MNLTFEADFEANFREIMFLLLFHKSLIQLLEISKAKVFPLKWSNTTQMSALWVLDINLLHRVRISERDVQE